MPYVKTTASPATEIYYQDVGEGAPIVLIHGWLLSHRSWESQINALTEAGHRVIAYDRRGFGESGKPAGGYDFDTFVSDLNDLMTHLDLRGATLAGFSMGGGEVVRYIARHGPSRVAKAMLLGSVTPLLLQTNDNPDGMPRSVFDGMVAAVRKNRLEFLDGFFPNYYNTDRVKSHADLISFSKWMAWAASPLGTQECVVAFGMTDFRDDLKKVEVPTLIVHGDEDRIVPIDISGRKTHDAIRGSRYEVLKGVPHGFAATHAETLNELMVDFMKA